MKQQKTLYELLETSPSATHAEIILAYQKLSQRLESGVPGLSQEDMDIQLKVIKQAYETLANDRTRVAYDAVLASRSTPDKPAISFPEETKMEIANWTPMKFLSPLIASLKAIVLIILIGILLLIYRNAMHARNDAESSASVASKQAEEKVILQEYYQENGIRPGSKIEADLLEVEARKKAEERRRSEEQERKYKQFEEEGRRRADEVSANLRQAEEEARRAEEYKLQQLAEAERNKKQAEFERIEAEKNKWRFQRED
jgi:curved DNA-binding protein CbpA